jgi:hypothetical protein
MPPKVDPPLSPAEREDRRREKAEMNTEIPKITPIFWKLDQEHTVELVAQLSMAWRELESILHAYSTRHCAHLGDEALRVHAHSRHMLCMDVTFAEAVESELTALGRNIRNSDRLTCNAIMAAIKDPAFNQAMNEVYRDPTKEAGRRVAHLLVFMCSKIESETFIQIFTVIRTYLGIRQRRDEAMRTYSERVRSAIRDVESAFTDRGQPTDWKALWKAITVGNMFAGSLREFQSAALIHVTG